MWDVPCFSLTRRTLNINCQDSNGDTPLHLAALNGHAWVASFLAHLEKSSTWHVHHHLCLIFCFCFHFCKAETLFCCLVLSVSVPHNKFLKNFSYFYIPVSCKTLHFFHLSYAETLFSRSSSLFLSPPPCIPASLPAYLPQLSPVWAMVFLSSISISLSSPLLSLYTILIAFMFCQIYFVFNMSSTA